MKIKSRRKKERSHKPKTKEKRITKEMEKE